MAYGTPSICSMSWSPRWAPRRSPRAFAHGKPGRTPAARTRGRQTPLRSPALSDSADSASGGTSRSGPPRRPRRRLAATGRTCPASRGLSRALLNFASGSSLSLYEVVRVTPRQQPSSRAGQCVQRETKCRRSAAKSRRRPAVEEHHGQVDRVRARTGALPRAPLRQLRPCRSGRHEKTESGCSFTKSTQGEGLAHSRVRVHIEKSRPVAALRFSGWIFG